MRLFSAAAVALGLTAALSACARPGNTPGGTPTAGTEVTYWASAQMAEPAGSPGLIAAVPGTPGVLCDGGRAAVPQPAAVQPKPGTAVRPKPIPQAGASSDAAADARERARRVLEAANPPIPRRGPVPPEAAARAEACVRALQAELNLLSHSTNWPDGQLLRTVLAKAGLTGIVVGPDSAFAAAAGRACVYGTFSVDGPDLSIGPPERNGACRL